MIKSRYSWITAVSYDNREGGLGVGGGGVGMKIDELMWKGMMHAILLCKIVFLHLHIFVWMYKNEDR